jgi:sugar phosphate permease
MSDTQHSYRWIILACGILAYATSYLTRWSYTGLASFISEDLHLDKADLGLLGSAFFYTYAIAQVPWGKSADRWGGRTVISMGVLFSAVGLLGFTLAQSFGEAVAWRMIIGVVAASVFVPVACLLSHWFASEDRGIANGVYYGLGGGLGQTTAFLLLPLLQVYFLHSTNSVFSGWRGAMEVVALIVAVLGLVCWFFLRSYPPQQEIEREASVLAQSTDYPITKSVASSIIKDPVLWCLGGYFAAGIIALRLVPGWLTIFASEWYRVEQGYNQTDAVIAGGVIGTVYTVGHVAGSPFLGKMSDRLLAFGVSRFQCAAVVLGLGAISVSCLTLPMGSSWMLGGVALLLGVTLHAFPIVNAAVSDRWGGHRTGHALGWINMVGQLAGAVALSVSGYVGMAWASGSMGTVAEYAGIWYLAAAACVIGAGCGWWAHRLTKNVVRIS